MKMTKALLLGMGAAAALTATQNLRAADFSPSDLANRAVAASPRAKEQFPWLTRQVSPVRLTPRAESVVSSIKKNRALAASPRMIEQFPELAHAEQPSAVASAKSGNSMNPLAEAMKNRSLAASPRMLEQFPELARRSQSENKSFEVAPLK